MRAKDRSLRDLGKKSNQLVWPFQYHPLLSVFQEIIGKITGNKTFWKKIQPIFSENLEIANKITYAGDNKNISNKLVSKELNNVFQNAT